jgi:type II restriction/modification system DNA methylase subunit YeeA
MNKSNLKSYAPQARKDFITAVTARASLLGITAAHVSAASVSGGVAIIDGMEWPAKVAAQRQALLDRIARHGAATQAEAFAQTMEEVAYTWFNRLVALRYLEIHELLDHGHRVLSSRDGGHPELLRHAADVALPGLQVERVQALQLAGNQDNALYKLLLVAQCNELSRTMPFLFERIDDDTELLLPDNLLRTDSIIAKLVAGVPEDDWQEIEVIGWLYQFYISEKKDQVIGKVVKSEDIPAVTQLFTPNWIVQYLVQNSVGRLWLMANPTSSLAQEWPYYIQPAEQTPEVQAQLDALIQTRVREDGDTLNPETITVLDPACGSGHILVVAYDVLKAIYLERGYQPRAVPRLILKKNLYGLDIDDRAAQLAGFALLMKARADDRRLFNEPIQLNVLALQESKGLDAATLANALYPSSTQAIKPLQVAGFEEDDLFPTTRVQMRLGEGLEPQTNHAARLATVEVQRIQKLIDTFAHAKTFGSLIQISPQRMQDVLELLSVVNQAKQTSDLYAKAAAQDLLPLLQQAQVLTMQFDAVVANPPYMGGKGMNPALKDYGSATFPDSKSDLFAMFMERGFDWCKPSGFNSMVTMQSWMFLSSYEAMRERLLTQRTLSCMVHMGNGVMGIAFGTAATVMLNGRVSDFAGSFSYCENDDIGEDERPKAFPIQNDRLKNAKPDDFKKIPGSPIAYWVSNSTRGIFEKFPLLNEIAEPRQGLITGENNRFIRYWYEVDFKKIGFNFANRAMFQDAKMKWAPINKGGGFRRWFGNDLDVVNWFDDGIEIRKFGAEDGEKPRSRAQNMDFYFKPGVTWGAVSSGSFSCRFTPIGSIFDIGGASCFPKPDDVGLVASILNSKVGTYILNMLNPTVNFQSGDVRRVPIPESLMNIKEAFSGRHDRLVKLTSMDWDSFEESWGFKGLDLLSNSNFCKYLGESWAAADNASKQRVLEVKYLEELNNIELIDGYGLQNELTSEVPEDQITLARADREKDCQRLISYAIGCMMGRYSLDVSGLIYAHAGNVGFDANRYTTFAADADGILPVTDEHWFADDAPERIREFLLAVWGPDTLEENMAWLAESLGAKAAETPAETIRRYIATKFFKDHLQTYKKRPIYWLFSSGKQGAFQALVYLHRYNESTLARMRAEYVIPLTAKMANRLEMLEQDAAAATSTAARTKLRKQIETLRKQQAELLAYDEKLRHHADMRITLDLDDGVKVNYGKFGDLLEGVKLVTGGSGDE